MSEREYSERPWGNYTVLDDDAPDHKVKRLVVHPGKRLSYQRHSQRAEHWFIVAGTATVTLDGNVTQVHAGEAIDIPLESAHRVANEGDVGRRLDRGAARDVLRRGRHRPARGRLRARRRRRRRRRSRHRERNGRSRKGPVLVTRIAELLAAGPTYSFEFFPPKNDKELATLARTISELQPLEPSFVSVTYRGGAESRQRTVDLVSSMLHTTNLNPMAHIICVAHTRLELADILVSCARPASRTSWPSVATRPRTRSAARASWPTPRSSSSWPGPSGASPSGWRPTRPAIRARPTCRATVTSSRPSSPWPTSGSPSSSSRPPSTRVSSPTCASGASTRPCSPASCP
jgi:mannose-6-phosphate isomerase